ncbi:MAG: hypothetical protein M1836_005871 [Candelina mexicana]|nr:MAG: hypothetical protein M1836_005871 [Candelina mexicana]
MRLLTKLVIQAAYEELAAREHEARSNTTTMRGRCSICCKSLTSATLSTEDASKERAAGYINEKESSLGDEEVVGMWVVDVEKEGCDEQGDECVRRSRRLLVVVLGVVLVLFVGGVALLLSISNKGGSVYVKER